MKRGAARFLLLSVGLGLMASPLMAERNLIPSLESIPDVCPERPSEPDWMQNIALRDAYQRVLVQDIYRAQNMERIVETGSCDCGLRFPAWDNAEVTFQENHANANRSEMLQASDSYNRRASDLRTEAQAICEAVGKW
ncbi:MULTISPECIES: hypothetical protein [Sulfitobacter]|jgi:hypothetical protein|uniref:hypothetical protein n=1 Tax=Sulfitobacter TaxID=60136 RepID=UPI0022AE87A6|nr:hypothetical protein [Sulfitobacter sp. G21635-S1]MCZ4258911.1 hypothetical protein [Sulfitobacter sp. G21635-S1]|tara:strand:- start:302 stop:715 length:414 start_codon:yes stop_codon:yes gene_type:complete